MNKKFFNFLSQNVQKPQIQGSSKLRGDDPVTDQLLIEVSERVYPSKRREFAIKHLGISEPQYKTIEEKWRYADQRKVQVNDVLTLA